MTTASYQVTTAHNVSPTKSTVSAKKGGTALDWFTKMFINEVKPALNAHSGGTSDDGTQMYILVDEDGDEFPAVLVNEETVFDATENDIREGKVAATDAGVITGTKDIPAYYVSEGYRLITDGSVVETGRLTHYDFTKLQAIICPFAKTVNASVAAEKVAMNENVYLVNSTDVIATVTKDDSSNKINFGFTNDSGSIRVLRYFTYKEEI